MAIETFRPYRHGACVVFIATTVMFFSACDRDENPTTPTQSTTGSSTTEVDNTRDETKDLEPTGSKTPGIEQAPSEQQQVEQPAQVPNNDVTLSNRAQPTPPTTERVDNDRVVSEPRADEVAQTMALESELTEIVAAASAKLDPEEAARLIGQVDQWLQRGFGCPDGPEKAVCQQFHLRSRIQEIDHRMRGYSTEY